MKLEKSDALKLKYEALRWLRLEQRCAFIATEVGAFSADALDREPSSRAKFVTALRMGSELIRFHEAWL